MDAGRAVNMHLIIYYTCKKLKQMVNNKRRGCLHKEDLCELNNTSILLCKQTGDWFESK